MFTVTRGLQCFSFFLLTPQQAHVIIERKKRFAQCFFEIFTAADKAGICPVRVNYIFRRMKDLKQLLGAIIGLIMGIILIVCGFYNKNKQDNYTETTAVITKIDIEEGVGDESDTYNIFVKYTVDDKEYNEKLDESSSSYSVGDEVKIKYNPSDPTDITSSSKWIVLICFIAGALLTLGSGLYLGIGLYYVVKK